MSKTDELLPVKSDRQVLLPHLCDCRCQRRYVGKSVYNSDQTHEFCKTLRPFLDARDEISSSLTCHLPLCVPKTEYE